MKVLALPLIILVLLLSACGGSGTTPKIPEPITPSTPEVRKLDIKIIPSLKDVGYWVYSWCDDCPYPSLTPKNLAPEDKQIGDIVVQFSPDNEPEIDINIPMYYSLSFKPTESLSEIVVPFIKKAIITRNGFVNNSNGSITFRDVQIESFYDGKVRVWGTCVAYGDDYKFNSIFDIKVGINTIGITSTNVNAFRNTTAQCTMTTSVESVNGIDPIFTF